MLDVAMQKYENGLNGFEFVRMIANFIQVQLYRIVVEKSMTNCVLKN